jgi:arylsulfatase A-like enzyme
VLGPTGSLGLNLNETTLGEQLKSGGYNTAIVGKWHLGQRLSYLPGNRGFDYYLGIPYSDDMGDGWTSQCPTSSGDGGDYDIYTQKLERQSLDKRCRNGNRSFAEAYLGMGLVADDDDDNEFFSCEDPAGNYLPLIYQEHNKTRIVEQPLDFTTLANKYRDFAVKFVERHAAEPFFLYMPFSHVHVTSPSQPHLQYAGCAFKNTTRRGPFGDALSEADDIVGAVVDTLRRLDLEENTLIIFSSDNGPWLSRGLSAGSAGLFTGRFAGYYETGKATTWEGGIRMPAFAYWKGIIPPYSRSAEIVSSLDVFPTLSTLAGVPLPTDRNFDGKDMTDVILNDGTSQHRDSFLFFYGSCHVDEPYYTVTAVRHGPYKAHWCTAPELTYGPNKTMVRVYDRYPLMFDVEVDPSESEPVAIGNVLPDDHADREAMERIVKAYAMEKATFQFGDVKIIPDGPGEGPGRYGLCCDRERNCDCRPSDENEARQNDKEWKTLLSGFFQVGSKSHHDRYHEVLNEEEPWPPRTLAQRRLHQM